MCGGLNCVVAISSPHVMLVVPVMIRTSENTAYVAAGRHSWSVSGTYVRELKTKKVAIYPTGFLPLTPAARLDFILKIQRTVTTVARCEKPVIAVAQHDDSATRKRALTAGARRVFSYNKMFSDGPQVVADLLAGRFS